MDDRPQTGPLTGQLIDAARRDIAEVDEQSRRRQDEAAAREAAAARRERRTTRGVLIGLVVVVLLLGAGLAAALVIATNAGERAARAETARAEADIRAVAEQLAQPVAERVLVDARAQSAQAARAELDRANARLAVANLPIVAPPPPDAQSAVVQVQASRALVLADLASSRVIADALRAQFGDEGVFPALAERDPLGGLTGPPGGDVVVDVLPEAPAPGRPAPGRAPEADAPRPPPGPPGPAPEPSPPAVDQPADPPAAVPPDRNPSLLRPCLLGRLLC